MKNFKVCYEFPVSIFILYSLVLSMIFFILYKKNIVSFSGLQTLNNILHSFLVPQTSKNYQKRINLYSFTGHDDRLNKT